MVVVRARAWQVIWRCHENSDLTKNISASWPRKKRVTFLFQRLIERQTAARDRGEEGMTYAQKVGSTICPMAKKSGEEGRKEGRKEGETKEVLNETLEKVSGRREEEGRKEESVQALR